MRRAAVVTGASSGIGLEISKRLCGLGYEVFGLGRDFEKTDAAEDKFENAAFHRLVCDILDTEKLCSTVKQILREYEVYILVNNAGVGYYGPHEELNPRKIQEMARTNLEIPMILTQQLLRSLKKNSGYVINISSVTAFKSNTHGCAYGATKAGLTSFSHSLFDEVRKYGVRVVTVHPDMTRTNLYRNADFMQGDDRASYLEPLEVAQAVEYILSRRDGMVVSDITLQPQIHTIKRKK